MLNNAFNTTLVFDGTNRASFIIVIFVVDIDKQQVRRIRKTIRCQNILSLEQNSQVMFPKKLQKVQQEEVISVSVME